MRCAKLGLLATLLCVPGASLASATPVLTLTGPSGLEVGASGDFTVSVAGLIDGAAPSLGAFDLELILDPAYMQRTATTFGDAALGDQLDLFGLGSLQGADFITASRYEVFELSFDSPSDLDTLQAGSFDLFTVTLRLIQPGATALSLANVSLSDAVGNRLTPIVSPAITVTAVPEPSTLLLLLIGGAFGRRRLLRPPPR